MNLIKELRATPFVCFLHAGLVAGLLWFAAHKNFPILQTVLSDEIYGDIRVARPLITYQELVVVFVDTRRFPAGDLAYRIAQSGAAVAIVDTARAMQALASGENHCLNADRVMEPMEILSSWAKASKDKRSQSWPVSATAACCHFFPPGRNQAAHREICPWISPRNCRTEQECVPR